MSGRPFGSPLTRTLRQDRNNRSLPVDVRDFAGHAFPTKLTNYSPDF